MTKKKDPKDCLKGGRPTKMTADVVAKLETAFSMGCSDVEACLFADIERTTLYRYQQANPSFSNRKEMLKKKLIMKARAVIAKALNDDNEDIARWFLERRCKDEFSTRQEITGEDGEPLAPVINIMPISSDK